MTSPKRILIVEDDAHIAELLRLHLRDEGYDVVHAANGDSGLRLLEDGGWDLLVLDLMLPGVDGLEICRRARAMVRYTPIIVTSARASEVHRIIGLELGADDYLAKPFSMLELVARVKALLRRMEALARDARMEGGALDAAGLRIDPLAREAHVDGQGGGPDAARIRSAVFLRPPSRQSVLPHGSAAAGLGVPRTTAMSIRSIPEINRLRRKVEVDPAAPRRILTVWARATGPAAADSGDDACKRLSLSQRLSLVFAVLLLACTAAAARLQISASRMREEETAQRLSIGLARHIADSAPLMDAEGLCPAAVRELFDKLMAVNPSVEVYLLSEDGHIVGDAAPRGHVKREQVAIEPVRRLLAGAPLPILGDDPAQPGAGRKVFRCRALEVDGRDAGHVYVVLQGERRDAVAANPAASAATRTTLLSPALVASCCLIAGLVAFGLITRPLRRLTAVVRDFDGTEAAATATSGPRRPRPCPRPAATKSACWSRLFRQMASRIAEQWRELNRQDQQRRELVANISHDLRTPLTSLHGYLETLLMKADTLDGASAAVT